MSYLDDQKTRMLAGHTDIKGIYADSTKAFIISGFKNSPSYYLVPVNTAASPTITSNLDAWVTDDPTKTKEVKQIQLIPNQTLNYGDVIVWLGDRWITTSVDFMGNMYYRGSMQKCYSSLKWLDSGSVQREAYFIITTDIQKGLGLNEGKIMFLPDERRYIGIQNNVDTLKIVKGQRFIFDNNRTWQVVSINMLITGLIHLELQEVIIDPSKDRTDLRIADYTQNPLPTGGNLW